MPTNHSAFDHSAFDDHHAAVDIDDLAMMPPPTAASVSVGATVKRKRDGNEDMLALAAAISSSSPRQIRPSPEGIPDKPKSTRINWGKSPYKEKLVAILNDWFTKTGQAIEETTGQPIQDYRVYAAKVGISRTTLFKYIHKDPSKRRLLREDSSSGSRGKKRLMDEEDLKLIVKELKKGLTDDDSPPPRTTAVDLIMKHSGLTRQAASRQLTRHVLPLFHKEGISLVGDDDDGDDSGGEMPAQVGGGVGGVTTVEAGSVLHESKRHIVISGVTSGLGRALLAYFYRHGHTVAGCGRRVSEIKALKVQYPNAKLSVVDVSDDKNVQLWAETICSSSAENDTGVGNKVDLVIANAGVSPETTHTYSAWQVPREDFDTTIDVNIKGVSNMIRHFVPRMLMNNAGTFVAMSSGLGRSPNPYHAAYCASKWAVEGMVKSLAMSLPDGPMCAVPLAPGVVQTGMQSDVGGKSEGSSSSSGNIDKWVEVAAPMILGLSRKDNGKSLSVKGFYSLRYRQSWSFPDGSGIPDRVGHVFNM